MFFFFAKTPLYFIFMDLLLLQSPQVQGWSFVKLNHLFQQLPLLLLHPALKYKALVQTKYKPPGTTKIHVSQVHPQWKPSTKPQIQPRYTLTNTTQRKTIHITQVYKQQVQTKYATQPKHTKILETDTNSTENSDGTCTTHAEFQKKLPRFVLNYWYAWRYNKSAILNLFFFEKKRYL